jgi:hypothetical protein
MMPKSNVFEMARYGSWTNTRTFIQGSWASPTMYLQMEEQTTLRTAIFYLIQLPRWRMILALHVDHQAIIWLQSTFSQLPHDSGSAETAECRNFVIACDHPAE